MEIRKNANQHMRLVLTSFLVLATTVSHSQALEKLDSVIYESMRISNFQCSIKVIVDIPGLSVPEKNIFVRYETGKDPVIKGGGLILMPKWGMMNQMSDLQKSDFQIIVTNETQDSVYVKIVSLDTKSEWVTADLTLAKSNYNVYRNEVITRKHGSFVISYDYEKDLIPSKTIIQFETDHIALPLKFMANRQSEELKNMDTDQPIKGMVTLYLSEVEWLYDLN